MFTDRIRTMREDYDFPHVCHSVHGGWGGGLCLVRWGLPFFTIFQRRSPIFHHFSEWASPIFTIFQRGSPIFHHFSEWWKMGDLPFFIKVENGRPPPPLQHGNTVNAWLVCILLECILVSIKFFLQTPQKLDGHKRQDPFFRFTFYLEDSNMGGFSEKILSLDCR